MDAGSLVFTGEQAGILLGYTDPDPDTGERDAIVARFASSEHVPTNELGPAPQTFDDGGGGVIGTPTADAQASQAGAETAQDPAGPTGTLASTEPTQAGTAAPVDDAAHEAQQDAEISQLQNEVAGSATTAPPNATSSQQPGQ